MTNDIQNAARELAECFHELEATTKATQYGALMEFVVTTPEALDLFKGFVYSETDSLPDNVIPFFR